VLYPPEFEARTIDVVRRCTDDITDCATAEVSVEWYGQAPVVRFVFGHPKLRGRPALGVALITESRKNPLAPGRLIQGDELRRHVRDSVERYLKANGIEIARKAMSHASL
jgi:hypothetical protein